MQKSLLNSSRILTLKFYFILLLTLLSSMVIQAVDRDTVFTDAMGYWKLGLGTAGTNPPLTAVGTIVFNVDASGDGAIPGAKVAQMTNACFNAGNTLNATGSSVTVYLRVRDPMGIWDYALFAKRGSHDIVNFNLFSVDLVGTTGNDIGFELHTANGFFMTSFPISYIQTNAWLDLVGRYDGSKIDLIYNGTIMASISCSGNLTQNSEPLLIGAETDGPSIVRLFSGEMEEAAVWNRALNDDEIAAMSRVSKLQPGTLLHYKHPDHAVGDVHPSYQGGVYYINYIYNPGTWNVAHLRSVDLLHWRWYPLTHTPPTGSQILPNYFALDVIYDPFIERYRTFYGYSGTRTSISQNRLDWDFGVPHLVIPDRSWEYDRMSDPHPLWNEDQSNYWIVMTLRKVGLPFEQAGAVGYATSSNLTTWMWQGELYFPGNVGDPEVPSLFKMGSKWYLLASYYNQAVGKPSYRISDSPLGPWTTPNPDSLDGKDFCAGISCVAENQRILFGWIPLTASQPGSQYWGGHLAFPREIHQLPDGRLGTRLETSVGQKIRGENYFPLGSTTLSPVQGSWSIIGNNATYSNFSGYGLAQFSQVYNRIDIELDLLLRVNCKRAGVIVDKSLTSAGFEIVADKLNQRFLIWTPDGTIHSVIPATIITNQVYSLRVIIEEDIVEAFLADQYSLVARIPKKIINTTVGLCANDGGAEFQNINFYRLKSLDEIPDPGTGVENWMVY